MFQNKLSETPTISTKRTDLAGRIGSTLFNLRKKIYFSQKDEDVLLDKEVSFYCNNPKLSQPITKQQQKRIKLDKKQRHDSLTFIADLASTSTPTRKDQQPITSTPKQTSHNPFKYHPTQTIRNKNKKKQSKPIMAKKAIQQIKITKRIKSSFKLCQNNSTSDCTNCRLLVKIESKKKDNKFQFVNFRSSSSQQGFKRPFQYFNQSSTTLASFVSCQTCQFRRCQANELLQAAKPKITKITSVTKRKLISSSNNKLKFKSLSNNDFEISLADLLYTPSKLRDLVEASNRSIKSSVAVKSAPVISSSAAALAKVYYL